MGNSSSRVVVRELSGELERQLSLASEREREAPAASHPFATTSAMDDLEPVELAQSARILEMFGYGDAIDALDMETSARPGFGRPYTAPQFSLLSPMWDLDVEPLDSPFGIAGTESPNQGSPNPWLVPLEKNPQAGAGGGGGQRPSSVGDIPRHQHGDRPVDHFPLITPFSLVRADREREGGKRNDHDDDGGSDESGS